MILEVSGSTIELIGVCQRQGGIEPLMFDLQSKCKTFYRHVSHIFLLLASSCWYLFFNVIKKTKKKEEASIFIL
jgi:hypothetical protein